MIDKKIRTIFKYVPALIDVLSTGPS